MHLLFSFLLFFTLHAPAESVESAEAETEYNETPSLVVGIMVDQMRPDYIARFWNHLGENGFKRRVNEGITLTNAQFNYVPTSTGPGLASVWSGTAPSVHGVIGNSWYVRELDSSINFIEMPAYDAAGGEANCCTNKGPCNLLTPTV